MLKPQPVSDDAFGVPEAVVVRLEPVGLGALEVERGTDAPEAVFALVGALETITRGAGGGGFGRANSRRSSLGLLGVVLLTPEGAVFGLPGVGLPETDLLEVVLLVADGLEDTVPDDVF